MRTLFCLFFVFNCFILFSQNKSYKLFKDSIFFYAKSDYVKSKKIFIENRLNENYDPANIYLYLEYSLNNNDFKFFEKEMKKLIKNYGFYYIAHDTNVMKIEGSIEKAIYKYNYEEWMINQTKKYYPKWLSKHPRAVEYQKELSYMLAKDQLTRNLIGYVKFLPVVKKNITDSVELLKYKKKIDTIYHYYDLQNVITLESLYKKNNNKALNNFENGLVYITNVIVFHNIKEGNLDEVWNRLFKFYESAYVEGKISEIYFEMYDAYLFKYRGVQYYGTLGEDIPIKDIQNYQERKNRLNLNMTKNDYL